MVMEWAGQNNGQIQHEFPDLITSNHVISNFKWEVLS
jgi:hypothetical protein